MTAEECGDIDVKTYGSLPVVNSNMVDQRVSSVKACVTEYLRKECADLNEVASDNEDDKTVNDDDASSKDVEVIEIGTNNT